MNDYQLLIIGAGPGGYEAAMHAVELGMTVAVIEKAEIGGTCLNRGCIPTKTLLHAAEMFQSARDCARYGLRIQESEPDMRSIFDRKDEVGKSLRDGLGSLLESMGVMMIEGIGTVCAEHSVSVRTGESEHILTGDAILIASGSVPARPPIPGLELDGVMTSDDILKGADKLYKSLVIMGGGVIGVELATFYSRLGTKVTILEGMDRLLPNMDKELGQNLSVILKKQGVDVLTKSMVTGITKEKELMSVEYNQGGKTGVVQGEKVLCSIGRIPNLEGVLGNGVELEMDHRRIKVDSRFKTSMPGVYAIGDVSSPVQLAHVASAQGRACVEMMAGQAPVADLNTVPGCVYCQPEIASAGLTEEEAKARGIPAVSGKYVMFSNSRTVIHEAPRSFIKIVANRENHRILGAHLMCEHATDMISELTVAIANGMTAEELLTAMRPHPTFEEGVTDALRALRKKW